MIASLLQEHAEHAHQHYHWSWFTPFYRWCMARFPEFMHWAGFDRDHPSFSHLGQCWFEAICFTWLVILLMAGAGFLGTRNLKELPRGLQNILEMIAEAMRGMTRSFIGPHGEKFTPYIGTIFFFIFFMNLIGLLPGGLPPTTTLSSTLALGIVTFFFTHTVVIREIGVGAYVRHLSNWIPTKSAGGKILQFVLLTPVLTFSHVLGELIRPVTLSFRLFVNMYGKEQVIMGIISKDQHGLVIGFFPVFFILLILAAVVSLIQAFLFSALTCVYISVFTSHEEEHHEEAPDGAHP